MTTAEAPVMVVTKPGVYTMTDEAYHADPVPTGSLSSTGARKLLPPNCPALFDWERKNPPAPKKTFDMGHAAHKLVLGVGPTICQVNADSWRTNAAKDAATEIRALGAVPLLTADYQIVRDMADALRTDPRAAMLLEAGSGVAEASLFATDEASGVMLRSRLDWCPKPTTGRLIIPDYKSAVSASTEKVEKSMVDFGYHQQGAFYCAVAQALAMGDDPVFVLIVQEKTAPYLVNVVQVDVEAMRIGRLLNRQAINIFAECNRTGVWPGYSDRVELGSLPGWYARKFEDQL